MIRRIITILAALLCVAGAQAQSLTETQKTALRAGSCADTGTGRPAMIAGDANGLRTWLNSASTFVVWRKSVQTLEIGLVVNYVAVAAMTTANLDRVRIFYTMNPDAFDPSRSDIRTYMADTFSGALGGQGQASRDALDAMYRRTTSHAERILSTGTGSTASPGTLTLEGSIDAPTATDLVFTSSGAVRGCP